MANFLKTSARSVVKLDPSLAPKDIAALADAGLTAYHAVKKAAPTLYPGTKAVVIGAGGLGHIGVQCLKALTPAEIIVVDRSPAALELTRSWGADHTVVADGTHVAKVKELTDGQGRALSRHKTRQAYAGYAKQSLERSLPATRKRYAHRLANARGTDIQNDGRNQFQNDAKRNETETA